MKKRIAVFVANYSIGNSPSIINLLRFLQKNYSLVDLYLKNVGLTDTPILKNYGIRVLRLFDGQRGLPARWLAKIRTYDLIIAIDPHGFVLCKEIFPNSNPIYYSLELYLKDDHYGLDYPLFLMGQERRWIKDARGLIIQSKEKRDLFLRDYNLSENFPVFILPVTQIGHAVSDKSDYLRQKYNIQAECKIALHLGGIADWYGCIEMAHTFKDIQNWILFFQGYKDPNYLEKFQAVIVTENIANIIISDVIYKDIEALKPVLMSCDLGIAWYKDISIGFRTAGSSSGKIPAYMRYGLPIVTKKYPSTIEAIQKPGCGLCVDSFDEIPAAIKEIEASYDIFSQASVREYERTYRFENYESSFMFFLSSLLKN